MQSCGMLYKLDYKSRKECKRREEELSELRRQGNLTNEKILEPFDVKFPGEQACLNYLLDLRWGESRNRFRCAHQDHAGVKCGGREFKETFEGRLRCTKCHAFISAKAGTLFQDSKLSLRQWFMAMWVMAYRKWGMNAVEVQRLLGIESYRIALAFLHKLRRAMSGENRKPLHGEVLKIMKIQIELSGPATWVLVVLQDTYDNRKEGLDKRQYPVFVRLRHLPHEDTLIRPPVTEWTKPQLKKRKTMKRKIVVWTEEFTVESWSQNYNHCVAPPASSKHGIVFADPQLVETQLRKWLSENFRSHVRTTYLQSYLDEFAFWYNRQWMRSAYPEYPLQTTHREIAFDQLLQGAIRTKPDSKKIRASQNDTEPSTA
ncbi:MAG: hypothetical protein ACLQPD_03015 [Desulfomonilaceae bacterium]